MAGNVPPGLPTTPAVSSVTPAVTPPTPSPSSASGSTKSSNQANDFMQLLVAQMTHQSPLNPTSSDQFMQQMAQMQMVTELHGLSTNMQSWASSQALSGASSLIGHTVKLQQVGSDVITGVVQSVSSQQGKVMVVVNGQSYDMSTVQEIK